MSPVPGRQEPGRKEQLTPSPDDSRAIALQRVGGAEQTLTLILEKFAEEAPKLLGNLTRGLDQQVAVDCERAAHTLKGNADILALAELVKLALEAELLCRQGDLEAVRRAVPALESATQRALTRIAAW